MTTEDRPPRSHHAASPSNSSADPDPESEEFIDAIADRVVDRLLDEIDGVSEEDQDTLLELSDVAGYLQVSERTVETLIAEGKIEPIWVRGQRRFTQEAIRAYVRRRAEQGKNCRSG